ncbi:complement C3-like [Babylonia areolata]|uniref:complement C3-like n=1 Tax=Babylonia areolata TaxID=304850 RepID=UPI003FD3D2AB
MSTSSCDLFKVLFLLSLFGAVCSQVIRGDRGNGMSVPTFVVTSPKRARYDMTTTFSVSATNVRNPASISLVLRTGFAYEVILNQTTFLFNNNGVRTWSVMIDSDRMLRHQQSSVQLRAEHGRVVNVTDIPMNPLSGFIMIQTDKVIYTPRQTVMYRVIALDDDQRFAQWPVIVDVKNPDLVILERHHHSSRDAFNGKNFTLPRDATPGTWSITAYYDGTKVRTTKTTMFDVQEYVLPTFKVQVAAQEKVIAMATNWIQIKTKAVYSYGQPVQGRAVMRLGVIHINTVALFNRTYNDTLDEHGEWNYAVPVADMRQHSAWFPDGFRLYIEVNVTEDGTGEVGKAVAMDTFFANPYYRISFDDSKKHFKPGFMYTFVMDVTAANGDPASNIDVYVIVGMRDANRNSLDDGFSTPFTLDEHGHLEERIMIPSQAEAVLFEVYTMDPRAPDWAFKNLTIHKYVSAAERYLHLQYAQNESRLTISYTPPSVFSFGPGQLITVLVLSRGHLVHSFTVPQDRTGNVSVPLSRSVLLSAAPTARVVAYFYVGGRNTELVSDSLLIDTPDSCREEVGVQAGLHLLPKQTTHLDIMGGPNMRVGLLAVDQAVYFLRDERSLTRSKVFSTLGEADEGRGIGDGQNTDRIFEYAGLQYMTLMETYQASTPGVDTVLDLSGLNIFGHFQPDVRRGNSLHDRVETSPEEEIPLELVRRYFPESWLFQEITLPRNGFTSEQITLPDSITTWKFTAVGVGAEGGVCMTRPLDLVAFKPFFAQVRLPYKAVRLEAVIVSIGIYNYQPFDINVTVTVTGDLGLCFTEDSQNQDNFVYLAQLRARRTNSEEVRIIPLVAGNVKLRVHVQSIYGRERDIVEKTLYVVAEGRRVQKSITFPLDPSGEHSSHRPANRNGVQRTRTATITSDLMGDIISTSVLDGDSLFENSIVDAEEAIGNLAPAVHALVYLNSSQFMTPVMQDKGQVYVAHGVSRLLTYRKQDGSFSLTPDSQPATWLTALVLKTLCQAEQITFVDHDSLIMMGFAWLLDQVRHDDVLIERDRRLARPSQDYDLMLSAEVLIALHECAQSRTLTDDDLQLMGRQELLLQENLIRISSPLVLAKAAYALTLSDPHDEATQQAVQILSNMKRTTFGGLHYWSVASHENDPPNRPFWYHSGSKASSVEATAYALLVFAKQAQAQADYADYGDSEEESTPPDWHVSLDSIAGWLIQKRNSRGAFIGAMDTAAATQALSEYSLNKLGRSEVNLHCNVTTNPTRNYSHSFDFTADNAITPKSLSNVPVGRQLRVETRGTGLGQMQVRVEYNVPVEANADCQYNVTITRRPVSYNWQDDGSEMCQYCQMGCDDGGSRDNRRRRSASAEHGDGPDSHRCRSTENMYADRTILSIGMLSGYAPHRQDLERIYENRESLSLSSLIYVEEKTAVEMKFNQVPHNQSTCVSFRAIERRPVQRRNPAIVTVQSHEDPDPTCIHTYDPVVSEVNLEVYCANNRSNNQGQCRCFSGRCGQCYTRRHDVSLNQIRSLVCSSEYIYKIRSQGSNASAKWVNMMADVVEVRKNGTEPADPQIQMVTPQTCACPHSIGYTAPHFFFGSQIDTFITRNNQQRKIYLVDDTTAFVSSISNRHSDPDRIANFINIALQRCGN